MHSYSIIHPSYPDPFLLFLVSAPRKTSLCLNVCSSGAGGQAAPALAHEALGASSPNGWFSLW